MTTVYDVPADLLIKNTAEKLKSEDMVQPPEWANHVKTGIHKELAPLDGDWWYTRCASVVRRIYIDGPVGISKLRSFYGGKQRQGVSGPAHVKGSGSIVREALQQLEKAGLVKSMKKGRIISSKGQSLLDNLANDVKSGLLDEIPGLSKY